MNIPILFLVADGMGDRHSGPHDLSTPLAQAETPWMDLLAGQGLTGTCQTIPQGMPPGSDVANMALLGYDPARHHTGRGPIEAAAQGLDLDDNDLVWRLNLVDLTSFSSDGIMKDYSAGHIDNELGRRLVTILQNELGNDEFSFHPGVQYRHLLVQKNGRTDPGARLDIRPPHDITGQNIDQDYSTFSGHPALFELLKKANAVVAENKGPSKAGAVWPWGQGPAMRLPAFREKTGLDGGVVSAVDLVKGLGRAAGMNVPDIPGATGFLDTDYQAKVRAALDMAGPDTLVYLHVEAPDECGHMGDRVLKTRAIEEFDARVVGPLYRALGRDAVWIVTCDHLTPLEIRTHSSEPVPFILSTPEMPVEQAVNFSEALASKSGIFVNPGHEFLHFVLRKTGQRHA